MADRKVSVSLELKAGQFKAEATAVEGKVRGVDRAVEELDRDITKIPADAAKAGAAMKLLGGAEDDTARGAKNAGKEVKKTAEELAAARAAAKVAATAAFDLANRLDGAGDQAGQLARKLLEAKAAAKLAASEFDGTEASVKRFTHAQSELARISTVAKNIDVGVGKSKMSLLDAVLPDQKRVAKMGTEAAGTFASAFQGGLLGTFKALPPEAKAALGASLVGVAIAAAPFIVSAINGALLAGIGAGGLAAGIAVQLQDPVVMGAFQRVGDHIQATLKDSTSSFRAPLLGVADDLDKSFAKIQPNIKGIFEGLAPSIGTLGKAVSRSIEILGPALERASGPASKVLDAIAAEIPEIAQQVGILLDDISEHGDSAAAAIKFILFNVEALIAGFDILVRTVGPAADGIVKLGQAMHLIDQDPPLTKVLTQLGEVPAATDPAIASFDDMGRAVYNTADAADRANQAFGDLFGQFMSLDQANLKVAEDFRTLGADIRKNKGSLDENTAAGEANRHTILGIVDDLNSQREAAIANGNGTVEATQKANAAFLAQLQRVRDVAAANGANTAQLDAMLAKYRALAGMANITKTVTIINTAVYRTVYDSSGAHESGRGLSRDRLQRGGIRKAASGLIVRPSDPGTLIGEPQTGGEALIPLKGITQSRAMDLAQTAVKNYGLQVSRAGSGAQNMNVTVRLEAVGSGRGMLSAIMEAVRIGELQLTAGVDGRVRAG